MRQQDLGALGGGRQFAQLPQTLLDVQGEVDQKAVRAPLYVEVFEEAVGPIK
jgi:hypothetical protein